MTYFVLARKFRPQKFSDIIGEEHIVRTLKNAVLKKRVAHAYIFSGPRGCGKTSMARILAKALNCKNECKSEPCGICDNCIEISKGTSIDVLEIDGASNNGIDEIKALRENVKFSSANSKYKIYIIDEAHQITSQAFNALLKTLEEPPSHVIFIMATTEQHKIPDTILSRCQKYRFKFISNSEIICAIKSISEKENFEIDNEALNIIAVASGGSMRDALSLLDQAISSSSNAENKITGIHLKKLLGLIPKDIIVSVTNSIAKNDIHAILKIVKEITEQGYDILQFARDLRDYLRKIMIYSINPEIAEIFSDDVELFEYQKTLFTIPRHLRMNNLLSKVIDEMRWHDHPRILLEMYLLKIAEHYYDVGELIKKIEELYRSIVISNNDNIIVTSSTSPKKQHLMTPLSQDDMTINNLSFVWSEIVSEIIKKHHLTAQPLRRALIKSISISSIQLIVSNQFDYNSILEFKEHILSLFKTKTGLDINMGITIEKNMHVNEIIQENITDQQNDKYEFEKNLKKNTENTIPKHIEEIAKKFGSTAKKL
ncbi:MAG: DNA polymerase III subunit gamma/tau [Endomicrobium sp.]|nr:DNA polymerase III subunit gamma/tau [Endomicrobium sp.]